MWICFAKLSTVFQMCMLNTTLLSNERASLTDSAYGETLENDGISMMVTSSPVFGSLTRRMANSMASLGLLKNYGCVSGGISVFSTRKGRSSSLVSRVKATPPKYLMRQVLPEFRAPTIKMHLQFSIFD